MGYPILFLLILVPVLLVFVATGLPWISALILGVAFLLGWIPLAQPAFWDSDQWLKWVLLAVGVALIVAGILLS